MYCHCRLPVKCLKSHCIEDESTYTRTYKYPLHMYMYMYVSILQPITTNTWLMHRLALSGTLSFFPPLLPPPPPLPPPPLSPLLPFSVLLGSYSKGVFSEFF